MMKYNLLAFMFMMLGLAACGGSKNNSNNPAVQAQIACQPNAQGQLIGTNGQACGSGLQMCAAQGLTFDPASGRCVSGAAGQCDSAYGCSTGSYGGNVMISCDYANAQWGYTGAYYVPMSTPQGYYCVNVQQYDPYRNWYGYSGAVYASSCPYGDYSMCANGWSSGGRACVGIGGGTGGASYGIGGYFGMCF